MLSEALSENIFTILCTDQFLCQKCNNNARLILVGKNYKQFQILLNKPQTAKETGLRVK